MRFYTGIHDPRRNPAMNAYMTRRVEAMKANGVWVFTRPLKYAKTWIKIKDDGELSDFAEVRKGREKGVDVRLALDLVRLGIENEYDIAIVVSTDTDLDEAVQDALELRKITEKWLAVENAVCMLPVDPVTGRRPPYKRLRSAGRLLHIAQSLFEKIRDDTDYWVEEEEEDNGNE